MDILFIFSSFLDQPEKSWERFSPNVDCVVTGSHSCSGHFTTLAAFKEHTMGRMKNIWKGPARLRIRNVIGGGDQHTACIEFIAEAECKNGLLFLMDEVMIVTFDEEGVVVKMRVYVDGALINKALEENEKTAKENAKALEENKKALE